MQRKAIKLATSALAIYPPFMAALGGYVNMPGVDKFQPDGWGSKARIGLISPHMDIVPEREFQILAPRDISVHAARVPLGWQSGSAPSPIGLDAVRAFADPPYVDDAVELLAAAPLDAIVYGFTSSSYLLGPDGDAEFRQRLEGRSHGLPIVIPCQSVLLALQTLGMNKLTMINPPWFPEELTNRGANYFRVSGVDVVCAESARGLASDPLSVTPKKMFEWVRSRVPDSAECVFLGGGGLRAISVIAALEEEIAKPVITANQIAFWHAIRLAGFKESLDGYGAIFDCQLPV